MKQPLKPLDVLHDPVIRLALAESWKESKPGLVGGHEEGGFIVLGEDDTLRVRRWPMGEGNLIQVPSHAGCAMDGLPIVATSIRTRIPGRIFCRSQVRRTNVV